ncbi:RnfABCDGE type electron transport complex subunit G [Desulfovibrio inopinatus]|uniref:RnfABCDGE type electron transport complex subunit G n=1 Tax=Desulfovibrio inopinatus TaxID=102109 RepID=UPI0004872AE0|nr:RnfABCDGE type electron transport complex subunit G [Desulfovibrio inopinatus]
MGEIPKMIVVLSLICGISGFTLAGLRAATQSRIEEQVLTYVQAPAMKHVLQGYDNDPIKDRKSFTLAETGQTITVFPALQNGKLVGVAFETAGKGYGGDIGVMVGFHPQNDRLSGIGITTLKETPGVGTRVTDVAFSSQFHNHSIDSIALSAAGGDIDGVGGATISSTGTVSAVQEAVKIYQAIKNDITSSWNM